MQTPSPNIIIFFLLITGIVLFLTITAVALFYFNKKKQAIYYQNIESLKLKNEKKILESQVEIQESTLQHISREIHDNIILSLTLAKLHLNTFTWTDRKKAELQVNTSIGILTQSISNLADLSKSLSSDIISSQGLINSLKDEVARIRQTGLFLLDFVLTGETVYLESHRELIIFRIIQEAFNNIIKHANATHARLTLHFTDNHLTILIGDNGKGFTIQENLNHPKTAAGLKNMETRTRMIGGEMLIKSLTGQGTTIRLNIPLKP